MCRCPRRVDRPAVRYPGTFRPSQATRPIALDPLRWRQACRRSLRAPNSRSDGILSEIRIVPLSFPSYYLDGAISEAQGRHVNFTRWFDHGLMNQANDRCSARNAPTSEAGGGELEPGAYGLSPLRREGRRLRYSAASTSFRRWEKITAIWAHLGQRINAKAGHSCGISEIAPRPMTASR
jgi:hypothetical protein